MKALFDTHLLLWAAAEPERLSTRANQILLDPDTRALFSAASIWEIAIKVSLARSDFDLDPRSFRRELLRNGYTELAIDGAHASAVTHLPAIHKDPFDRLLVAQATVEGIPLITADSVVARYGDPVELV